MYMSIGERQRKREKKSQDEGGGGGAFDNGKTVCWAPYTYSITMSRESTMKILSISSCQISSC
jgi:hypothetical protein